MASPVSSGRPHQTELSPGGPGPGLRLSDLGPPTPAPGSGTVPPRRLEPIAASPARKKKKTRKKQRGDQGIAGSSEQTPGPMRDGTYSVHVHVHVHAHTCTYMCTVCVDVIDIPFRGLLSSQEVDYVLPSVSGASLYMYVRAAPPSVSMSGLCTLCLSPCLDYVTLSVSMARLCTLHLQVKPHHCHQLHTMMTL